MSERRAEINRRWGQRLPARTYQKGRMREVTLREGPQRAAHLDPAADPPWPSSTRTRPCPCCTAGSPHPQSYANRSPERSK